MNSIIQPTTKSKLYFKALDHMSGAKGKTVFVCDACGYEAAKWEGRCPSCEQWNTLAETRRNTTRKHTSSWLKNSNGAAVELAEVSTQDVSRLRLSSSEMNRALGGGVVPGSLILIAGDPGIGKSTLLLRVAMDVADTKGPALYVAGEESASQVKLRAERLGISGSNLYLLPSTDLEEVLANLDVHNPTLVVVDSIQTMFDSSLPSGIGSVAQIRECTRRLMEWAKARNVAMILTGHVTKGGDIAGPRVLEHMVDVVLYMEGDPISSWRLLRTIKNRFGSTNEVGVFEMTGQGLLDVEDPSRSFLAERREGAIGSVIVAAIEGSRPLLVEVQALTSPSFLPTPRRVATGIDVNRLHLVCAVLTRRAGISLANQDIVVNVTGGLKITEPAADLGLALAIASNIRNLPVDAGVAAIGELGLSGEVRRVMQLDRRVDEVARLGLKRCLVPGGTNRERSFDAGFETIHTNSVSQAINLSIPKPTWSTEDGP